MTSFPSVTDIAVPNEIKDVHSLDLIELFRFLSNLMRSEHLFVGGV